MNVHKSYKVNYRKTPCQIAKTTSSLNIRRFSYKNEPQTINAVAYMEMLPSRNYKSSRTYIVLHSDTQHIYWLTQLANKSGDRTNKSLGANRLQSITILRSGAPKHRPIIPIRSLTWEFLAYMLSNR